MPGAPSSFLLLVVMPGATSSVLAPSSDAIVPSSDALVAALVHWWLTRDVGIGVP